jgi:hypothetical protein
LPHHHDKVPNLKLVMNPEGKLHDWTDVPEDELPELQQIASGGPSAEIAQNVVENLQTCKGRGKSSFYIRGLTRPTGPIWPAIGVIVARDSLLNR